MCRSIRFGDTYYQYATERVKYLLNEVINNYCPNDVTEEKMVVPSVCVEQLPYDEYFEIMV